MMHKLGIIGLLGLAASSCVRLNPSYADSAGESGPASSTSTGPSPTSSSSGGGGTSEPGTTRGETGPPPSSETTDPPTPVEFVDERWDGEFGEGIQTDGFQWQDSALQLSQRSAAFQSRIFDAERETEWTELRWQPRGAYSRPLPSSEVSWNADPHTAGPIGFESLSLLLHLDDGPWSLNDPVLDVGPVLTGPRWVGSGADVAPGIFGAAMDNPDSAGLDHIIVPQPSLPGEGPFTWTMWFQLEACVDTTLISVDATSPVGTTTTFLLCIGEVDSEIWCDGRETPLLARVGPLVVCSSKPVGDGDWHHIAMTRTPSGGGQTLELIIDGEPPETADGPGLTDVSIHPEPMFPEVFTIAGGNETIYGGLGRYDEVALWNRALSGAEIQALYHRGSQQVEVQVRGCETPDCRDATFAGPGPAQGRGFVDLGPEQNHSIDLTPLGLESRYVQYRLFAQRPAGGPSPAIERVELRGVRQ